MAKFLITAGVIILCVGLLMHFAPGLLKWFGHLPGDIRIENDNTRIYIPITSMILISLVLTIIANLWR
ncbi:DUF2905 domain-containing protein [Endozoicomonas gorgoniicola]|uniref:DUF2905 domain-containing protein n=1 Tax=Endozoicomonas gorgoniicola TaxID=1234144 RepID=A0ABT3MS26_9GAMM|nr:DUF2905 domain-containing protein [Endozoicomonas gorgoniicola]MCW7551834.1 DUF2905 domain-containing protein [Endozoicomonas gorgoniicola]